ncbi:hypothetical protein ABEU95_13970 [Heyndrickxia faecalis]
MSKASDQRTRDEALCECIKRGIYSASEYSDVLAFIQRQQQQKEEFKRAEEEIKALHGIEPSLLDTQPENRELAQYLDVLKGATKYDTVT